MSGEAFADARAYLGKYMPGNDADLSEQLIPNLWMMSGLFKTRRRAVPALVGLWDEFEEDVLTGEIDEDRAAELIASAGCGDAEADLILRGAVAVTLARAADLPPALARYASSAILAAPKIPSRLANSLRDRGRNMVICMCIGHLVERHDLKATRNAASQKPSACSIVAECLGMEEAAVRQIWRRKRGARMMAQIGPGLVAITAPTT